MANLIEQIEQEQIKKVLLSRPIPNFRVGDVIKVANRVASGTGRIQVIEGLVIAKSRKGIRSSFLLRKMSDEYGAEHYFPMYSPLIQSITIVKKGRVRKAKIYYFRHLKGKSARIKEDRNR